MGWSEMRPQSLILILLLFGVTVAGRPSKGEGVVDSVVTFYFYGNRLMFASANMSVLVFDRADVNRPVGDNATVVECVSQIRQVVLGMTGWIGGVSWGSRRLLSDTRIFGTVRFHCWLSSEESLSFWELSGVGVGVAEVDQRGAVVWGPVYGYVYSFGSMLSFVPSEHSIAVDVDHTLRAGNHILFGVVVGSTRQGWRAKVHLGSSSYPSGVMVPFQGMVGLPSGDRSVCLPSALTPCTKLPHWARAFSANPRADPMQTCTLSLRKDVYAGF